jgi:hypothetical protein
VLGLRLPPEYNRWVAQDVKNKRFVTWRGGRTLLWLLVLVGLAFVGYRLGRGQWLPRVRLMQATLIAAAVALFSSRESLVRRTLQWHRIDKRGGPAKKVKRLGLLGNREAVALGVVVVCVWVAGAYVLGYGSRPTGPAVAKCQDADPALMQRILAGRKDPKQEYVETRQVDFRPGSIITGVLKPPAGQTQTTFETWLIRTDGKIERIEFELGKDVKLPPASTTFPKAEKVDRLTLTAALRTLECLAQEPRT